MNRNERHKMNKQKAKQDKSSDPKAVTKGTYLMYVIGFGALLWSYYIVFTHWSTVNFVFTVAITALWLYALVRRMRGSRKS